MDGKILIVDDEEGIRNALGELFARQGFRTVFAVNGEQTLERVRDSKPDIVILDLDLPTKDGLEICIKIRQEKGQKTGIIMISGIRKEIVDKVVGLELGADAYLTKPFEVSELMAQTKALLRRLHAQSRELQTGWFIIDDRLRINFEKRIVEMDEQEVHLTKLEFDLLRYLAERPGMPVARSDLLDNVWGYRDGDGVLDSAVNTAISKLRSKLEPDLANPRYIISVHGIGYRFKMGSE